MASARPIAVALLLAGASGCVGGKVILLKNMQSGQVVECRASSGASILPRSQVLADNAAAEDCAAKYQAAGYLRIN